MMDLSKLESLATPQQLAERVGVTVRPAGRSAEGGIMAGGGGEDLRANRELTNGHGAEGSNKRRCPYHQLI